MPEVVAVNATLTLGGIYDGIATAFRVWAPDRQLIEVVLDAGRRKAAPTSDLVGAGFSRPDVRALTRDDNGYWYGRFEDVQPGARYRYRIDGNPSRSYPDPASRFQPEGVHGPSQVIDPASFQWTDAAWQPPSLDRIVFYELHVGTFTPEGTFSAAIHKLEHLEALGVSAIELMPVADFPGERNWGYDGVALFAPARCYGHPDDLRALVDAAHRHGLAVFLDVVYNHFGPDGAYATAFSDHYFTDKHRSPWGRGINLDDAHSVEVRRFFMESALHWVAEYHFDGLRLDATHALKDDSPTHFLAELAAFVRSHASKRILLMAEDHRNLDALVRPFDSGGMGFDGIWADDFHHHARVRTARDYEGYYADFSGSIHDLAETIRHGWFFRGQMSRHLGERRGTETSNVLPEQFIVCIQNHDQIGNRADGARLHHEIDPAVYRALSALLLLVPQTPLLFMGQEWAATSPFLFFTDHHAELGRMVTAGRRQEFSAFAAFADESQRVRIPDPQAVDSFERSRLQWNEIRQTPHSGILNLYRRLLGIRDGNAAWDGRSRDSYRVDVLDDHTLAIQFIKGPWLVITRLSGGSGRVHISVIGALDNVVTTEDPEFVEEPRPMVFRGARSELSVAFERPGAAVIRGLQIAAST